MSAGMTVEEAEKLAREWTEEYQSHLEVGELSNVLAEFVLAVLPVVRAAMVLRKESPVIDASEARERHFHWSTCDLIAAIDTLRAAMEGK